MDEHAPAEFVAIHVSSKCLPFQNAMWLKCLSKLVSIKKHLTVLKILKALVLSIFKPWESELCSSLFFWLFYSTRRLRKILCSYKFYGLGWWLSHKDSHSPWLSHWYLACRHSPHRSSLSPTLRPRNAISRSPLTFPPLTPDSCMPSILFCREKERKV